MSNTRPQVEEPYKRVGELAKAWGVTAQRTGLTVSALGIRDDADHPGKTVSAYGLKPSGQQLVYDRLVADGHIDTLN